MNPVTAHMTAYVWYRNGLSHRVLASLRGRAAYYSLAPAQMAYSWFGSGPTFETVFLWRHRLIDLLLARAIDDGRVTQVLEVAAGLSGRGWRFKQAYGSMLRYVESDLPAVAARKRQRLMDAGLLAPGHEVVALNLLQETGEHSLASAADRLDAARGTAVVVEGLLNYLPRDGALAAWRRIVAMLRRFPAGTYLGDLYIGDEGVRWPGSRVFRQTIAALSRSPTYIEFATPDAVRDALTSAGFESVRIHDPKDYAALLDGAPRGGGSLVRVLEASARSPEMAVA